MTYPQYRLHQTLMALESLFQIGDVIGRYRIEARQGGHGGDTAFEHYRIRHQETGRIFLLISLSAKVALERAFMLRLRAEGAMLARFDNKNVIRLVEHIEGVDQVHLVLDFAEGETLQAWADKQGTPGRSRTEEVTKIIGQILDGLAYIHREGIVHRDLQPTKILVPRSGEAKIAGFELAGPILAPSGLKPIKPTADIYAIGIIAYYLLTGERPSGWTKAASRFAPDLDPQWDNFIRACVAESPEQRFRDGAAALAAFRLLEAQTDHGSRRSWTKSFRHWLRLG